MPYVSDKQRRFMWSQKPEIAKKWAEEGHGNVKKSNPKHQAMKHLKARKKSHNR